MRQTAGRPQISISLALIDRFSVPGTAKIVRAALCKTGIGSYAAAPSRIKDLGSQGWNYRKLRVTRTDRASNQMFTKIIDLPCVHPTKTKQQIMISPPYTPFAEQEVRYALGLTRGEYIVALRSGILGRSVHFENRVSPTTALHNLIDVVRFDVLSKSAPERAQLPEFVEQCDRWLDELCCLDEDCESLSQTTLAGDTQEVIRLVLPQGAAPNDAEAPTTWHGELIVLTLVVASWCRCYRALNDMLVADECRCKTHQIGGRWSSVPNVTPDSVPVCY